MNFNDNHPELKEGEVFLGNSTQHGFNRSAYNTKRLGAVAYYVDNEIIASYPTSRPMFVAKTEYDECMAVYEALNYSKNT